MPDPARLEPEHWATAACSRWRRPGDGAGLRRRGVGFRSLHEALDTTTPGDRLVFHVFAALAEFIRELIVEGTREGLDAARARGQRLGRPPAMTAEQIRQARDLLHCRVVSRRECPMSSATTTRSVLPRTRLVANVCLRTWAVGSSLSAACSAMAAIVPAAFRKLDA